MLFTLGAVDSVIDAMDACPWSTMAGRRAASPAENRRSKAAVRKPGLYTPEERQRRDSSPWTFVQGVLAPVQFVVFLISLYLVLSYLATGQGFWIATASIVVKTLVLYTIMVTGAIWEREVFGRYLFAPAFYWEDVFSILVLALHTGYLVTLFVGVLDPVGQMYLALLAYATYVINAGQFLLKLRAARLQGVSDSSGYSAG